MTTLAGGEILASERPFSVMTGRTAYAATRREMHGNDRLCHASVSASGNLCVTRRAVQSSMAGMAEIPFVGCPSHGQPRLTLLMAGTAGIKVLSFCDLGVKHCRAGRVTLKTGRMGRRTSRDRKADAPRCRTVAIRAVRVRSMCCVIELCTERGKLRERLNIARSRIRMANRTDRVIFLLKMLHVATGTRRVARQLHLPARIFVRVADQARQALVLFAVVVKFRIILVGSEFESRCRRSRRDVRIRNIIVGRFG